MKDRKALLEIIFILGVSLFIFTFYAVWEEDLALEYKPKKSQMAQYFTQEKEAALGDVASKQKKIF